MGSSYRGAWRAANDAFASLLSIRRPSPDRGAYELVDNVVTGEGVTAAFHDSGAESSTRVSRHVTDGEESQGRITKSEAEQHDGLRVDSDHYEEPTERDKQTLRRIADKLPWSTFLVAAVELCERFTYYGLSGPFQNYIQNAYNDPGGLPGAIGLGQQAATGLTDLFQFWCYVTPIIGAVVADQYLGKYWAIFYFAIVYFVGMVVLVLTSLPVAITNGVALGGLIVAMIVIGLGTGGIKSNVSPLIAEQYTHVKPYIRTLGSGERVIIDPAVTVQRIYMIFYLCINVGSFSSLATTYLEKDIGFWSAYLLCLCTFIVGFAVLVSGKKKYVVRPPKGSVIPHALRICWIGLRHRGKLDAAKPEFRLEYGESRPVPWDGLFVDEVRRALVACKVFLFYPIYWVVYNQMLNNFISQAGDMDLHGIPNDVMGNIDPLTIIVFIPICDRILYPSLRRIGIPFKPITRIFMGFLLGAAAMAYAAAVQKTIYSAGPCYDAPRDCPAAARVDGSRAPNDVHVALQTPAYLLIGLSEIFASVTGLEYAFTKAPPSMKSFIMSLFLSTSALGAALGVALAPSAHHPNLLSMYLGLAVACLAAGLLFWFFYRKYNDAEDELNELEQYGETPLPADRVASSVGTSRSAGEKRIL